MATATTIDPSNVSNILFSSENDWSALEPYIHPDLVIVQEHVVSGRGFVATASIKTGTCLFVTPPTVMADKKRVRELFMESNGSSDLASLAEQSLLQAMRQTIREEKHDLVQSFLALVGGDRAVDNSVKNDNHDLLDRLLGRHQGNVEEHVLQSVSDDDLLQIVRRNGKPRIH